jgi:WD40 repeat protein
MSVALTADNQNLVSAEGKRLRVLKLVGDVPARDLLGHSDTVRFIAMQADGARMASCSQDRTIIVWKTESWSIERILAGHDGVVRQVHLAADMLLSCSSDETTRLWSLETGRCKFVLSGHGTDVRGCAMSADGSLGYSCGFDKTVRKWDLGTGKQIAVMSGHTDKVFGVASAADGSWALSCSWDKTIRLWDPTRQASAPEAAAALLTVVAQSGPVAAEASDQGKEMLCVGLSGDGSRVVTCSVDGAVRVWDAESAEQLHKCTGHTDWVWGLAVTQDGALAASCSRDFTARVWDLREGREVRWAPAVQRGVRFVCMAEALTLCAAAGAQHRAQG